MSTLTDEQLARRRVHTEAMAEAGERWLEIKRAEIEKLPTGTIVIVDSESGEYVTGATRIEAMDNFDRKFGPGRPGFMHAVGRRVFLGGGLLG